MMTDEWQHPDRLADRFHGVLQNLDRCSPLNTTVAKEAANAIREILRVYRFLDDLFSATTTAHLDRIDALTTELAAAKGERAQIVAWLLADQGGRGLVEYRDCWNIAAMIDRGDHASGAHLTSEGEA